MKQLLFFLMLSTTLFSQTADELFNQANTLYKNGEYEKAVGVYQQIEKKGFVSSALYYNLANAYYKLNKVAPSIYNYEKALQLNPNDEDVKNNLIFAKRLTLDRIEPLPPSIFDRLNTNILQKLSYNTWAILAVVFSVVSVLLFLLFYYATVPSKKRLFFITSIMSFLVLLFTVSIAYQQYGYSKNTIEATVFSEEVSVKNEPTQNSDEVFVLHEGTKVKLIDTVDDWYKIKLVDGKIGWLKSVAVKPLN